jgi:hypothetical protein
VVVLGEGRGIKVVGYWKKGHGDAREIDSQELIGPNPSR